MPDDASRGDVGSLAAPSAPREQRSSSWFSRLLTRLRGRPAFASRSYRFLARLIDREFPASAGCVCLAITAPEDDRVTTDVLLMLAHCLRSEFDRHVLLVDARMRDPDGGITGALGLADVPGVADVVECASPPDPWPIGATAIAGVDILPSGQGSPAGPEAARLGRLRDCIESLRPRYGFILVQVGAALADTRNLVCAAQADAVLLVAEENRTLMRLLDECRRLLAANGARDIRVVLAGNGG